MSKRHSSVSKSTCSVVLSLNSNQPCKKIGLAVHYCKPWMGCHSLVGDRAYCSDNLAQKGPSWPRSVRKPSSMPYALRCGTVKEASETSFLPLYKPLLLSTVLYTHLCTKPQISHIHRPIRKMCWIKNQLLEADIFHLAVLDFLLHYWFYIKIYTKIKNNNISQRKETSGVSES